MTQPRLPLQEWLVLAEEVQRLRELFDEERRLHGDEYFERQARRTENIKATPEAIEAFGDFTRRPGSRSIDSFYGIESWER